MNGKALKNKKLFEQNFKDKIDPYFKAVKYHCIAGLFLRGQSITIITREKDIHQLYEYSNANKQGKTNRYEIGSNMVGL